MTKIYTVYEGEYTTRRTEKFRQVNQGIQELLDHGVSEKEVSQEATGNHEKAHVLGHPPGRTGRIVARGICKSPSKDRRMEHPTPS
jgi:hypothetical protein